MTAFILFLLPFFVYPWTQINTQCKLFVIDILTEGSYIWEHPSSSHEPPLNRSLERIPIVRLSIVLPYKICIESIPLSV